MIKKRQICYLLSNGLIEYKGTFKDEIFVDSLLWYHSNGIKNIEEVYDSTGKEQGIFKIYYDNGQLNQFGKFKNGKLDDSCISFDRNGKRTKREFYKNDSLKSSTN